MQRPNKGGSPTSTLCIQGDNFSAPQHSAFYSPRLSVSQLRLPVPVAQRKLYLDRGSMCDMSGTQNGSGTVRDVPGTLNMDCNEPRSIEMDVLFHCIVTTYRFSVMQTTSRETGTWEKKECFPKKCQTCTMHPACPKLVSTGICRSTNSKDVMN